MTHTYIRTYVLCNVGSIRIAKIVLIQYNVKKIQTKLTLLLILLSMSRFKPMNRKIDMTDSYTVIDRVYQNSHALS